MQVTKEYIEAQLANLKKQHEQHVANANAVNGAIQVYEQLLSYMALEEAPDEVRADEVSD